MSAGYAGHSSSPSTPGASLPHPDTFAKELLQELSIALEAFKKEFRGRDELAAVTKVFKRVRSVLDHGAPPPRDHENHDFIVGDRTILYDLRQRSDLNGCLAIVKSRADVVESDGRVEVSVGMGSKKETVRVKPGNLRLQWHVAADLHVAMANSRVIVRSLDSTLRGQVCQVISSDPATRMVTVRAATSTADAAPSLPGVLAAGSGSHAAAGRTENVSVSGLVPAIYFDIAKEALGCAVKIALQAAGGVASIAVSAITDAVTSCAHFYIRSARGPEAARASILFLKTLFKGGQKGSSTPSSCVQDFHERQNWTYTFVHTILQYIDVELQSYYWFDEAISVLMLCKEVIHTIEQSESYNYFTLLNNLGNLFSKQMRLDDAEASYKEALSISEKSFCEINTGLGETAALYQTYDVSMAATMRMLAMVHIAQHRWVDADALYRNALQKQERKLGRESLEVSSTLLNIADLYTKLGRLEDGERLVIESIRIRQMLLGPDSLGESESLSFLASVYEKQNRVADAETVFLRALRLQQQQMDPFNPVIGDTLNRIAVFYSEQERYSEAEEMYTQAMHIIKLNQGPESLRLSTLMSSFGVLLLRQDRLDAADAVLKDALRIKEKTIGRQTADAARDLGNLGSSALQQERFSDAEELFQESMRIKETVLGHDSLEVALSLRQLSAVYMKTKREDEAEATYVPAS
jgi:tetratricopeptide (TPR) repeat protein